MYKKMEQTQSLSQFSNPDKDDSHNGFVFYHRPYWLYIIVWEAIFLPDIFSVSWCFLWADGMYSFTFTKGAISAEDYRKWFEWIDLTGRITCKTFWPFHVSHFVLIVFCLKLIYSIQYSKGFDLILPIRVLLTGAIIHLPSFVDQETGIY